MNWLIKSRKYALLAVLGILVGCSYGGKASSGSESENVIESGPAVVAATFDGLVHESGNVLPGTQIVKLNIGIAQLGFADNHLLVATGNGVVTPGQHQWDYINSDGANYNISINSMAVSNSNVFILYKNVLSEGLYVSESVVGAWVPFNNNQGVLNAISGKLAVNKSGTNVYVGVEEQSGVSMVYQANNGQWESVVNQPIPENAYIYAMTVDDNNKLYIAANTNSNGTVFVPINNQWESVGGGVIPDGGRIYSLAASGDGVLYAGTSLGHIYRLKNSLWEQVVTPSNFDAVEAMAVHQGDLYAGIARGYAYKLTGDNWSIIANGPIPESGSVFSLTVDKAGTVVVGDKNGGIYQALGDVWRPMVSGSVSTTSLIATFVDHNGNIYTGGMESNNQTSSVYGWDGNGWSVVNNSPLAYGGLIRAFAADNDNNLYVATFNSTSDLTGGAGAVYKSQGGRWQVVNGESLPYSSFISSMVIKQNKLFVGATALGMAGVVFESVNGAWQAVNESPVGSSIGAIAVNESGVLYAATGGIFGGLRNESGLVFESVNGSWRQVNSVIPESGQIFAMAFNGNKQLFIGTMNVSMLMQNQLVTNGAVYESVNGTWHLVNNRLLPDSGGVLSIQFDKNDNLYAGTFLGNVYESKEGQWILKNRFNSYMTSFALKEKESISK